VKAGVGSLTLKTPAFSEGIEVETGLMDTERQALLASDRIALETHQKLIPFLETLGVCGSGRQCDSAFLSLELKNPALTIDPRNSRHDGVPC
jgi:hypothetical protein